METQIQKLKEAIKEQTKELKEIRITRGAFSDTKSSLGIIEYVKPIPGKGTFTKYFGNEFIFKGYPDFDLTEQLALGKAFLSRIPREVFWSSFYWKLVIALRFIFARKKFYNDLWNYVLILRLQLEKVNQSSRFLQGYQFSEFSRELKRALHSALEKSGYKDPLGWDYTKKGDLGSIIANLAEFFFFFIEFDFGYRFILQDLLEEIDITNDTRKEIKRLKQIFIARSSSLHSYLIRKFIYAFKIIEKALYSKKIRDIVKNFFFELDYGKIRRDEHDWYYCLDRLYNHRGLSLSERRSEKQKLDNQKGNIDLWESYEKRSELKKNHFKVL